MRSDGLRDVDGMAQKSRNGIGYEAGRTSEAGRKSSVDGEEENQLQQDQPGFVWLSSG
jgi:hypothetical protein